MPIPAMLVPLSIWGILAPAPSASTVRGCVEGPVAPLGGAFEAAWTPVPMPLAPAGVTAFVDVNVVPMDTNRVLEHQTVLVEDGKIIALGPVGKVKVPAGAVRVEGKGRYLMPGLGAMHEHFTHFSRNISLKDGTLRGSPRLLTKLASDLAEGVTSLGTFEYSALNETHLKQARSLIATVPSPRIYFARSLFEQPPGSMVAYVTAAKAAGYDHIETSLYGVVEMSSSGGLVIPPDSIVRPYFDALVAAVRQVGIPLTAHSHYIPFDKLLTLGSIGGSADHVYALYRHGAEKYWARDTLAVLLPVAEIQARAAAVRRAGVWITPTLRCIVANMPSSGPGAQVPKQVTKALQDAGVGLLLSTDDGWDAHDELTSLVDAGLTPYQALVTGTKNVAKYFGRLDQLGTVTVGKRADLLLLAGNPLADVRHAREPMGVMVDGRWFDRTMLDSAVLVAPKEWLKRIARERGSDVLGGKHGKPHRDQLKALTDSLELAGSQGPDHERLLRRFADELGALRAVLPSEQQREWLDPHARAWMRVQVRKGHVVTVPGVPPSP